MRHDVYICALEACSAGLGVEVVEPIGGGIIKGVAMYLGAYFPSEDTNAVFIGLKLASTRAGLL